MKKDIIKDVYLNIGYIIAVGGAFLITIPLVLLLNITFSNPLWVVVGSYIWLLIVGTLILTRYMPIILIVYEDKTVEFIGVPWHYKFDRKCVEGVIIASAGIIFSAKAECAHNLRFIPKYKEGIWSGKKYILFVNIKGLGALIDALSPIDGTYGWDNLSPEKREYLEKRMYDAVDVVHN